MFYNDYNIFCCTIAVLYSINYYIVYYIVLILSVISKFIVSTLKEITINLNHYLKSQSF